MRKVTVDAWSGLVGEAVMVPRLTKLKLPSGSAVLYGAMVRLPVAVAPAPVGEINITGTAPLPWITAAAWVSVELTGPLLRMPPPTLSAMITAEPPTALVPLVEEVVVPVTVIVPLLVKLPPRPESSTMPSPFAPVTEIAEPLSSVKFPVIPLGPVLLSA